MTLTDFIWTIIACLMPSEFLVTYKIIHFKNIWKVNSALKTNVCLKWVTWVTSGLTSGHPWRIWSAIRIERSTLVNFTFGFPHPVSMIRRTRMTHRHAAIQDWNQLSNNFQVPLIFLTENLRVEIVLSIFFTIKTFSFSMSLFSLWSYFFVLTVAKVLVNC